MNDASWAVQNAEATWMGLKRSWTSTGCISHKIILLMSVVKGNTDNVCQFIRNLFTLDEEIFFFSFLLSLFFLSIQERDSLVILSALQGRYCVAMLLPCCCYVVVMLLPRKMELAVKRCDLWCTLLPWNTLWIQDRRRILWDSLCNSKKVPGAVDMAGEGGNIFFFSKFQNIPKNPKESYKPQVVLRDQQCVRY